MSAKPWNDVSLDIMTGLPHSKGKDAILVIVCRFSKMAKLIPIRANYKASDVAHDFVSRVMADHGLPQTVISDRDSKFVSEFW